MKFITLFTFLTIGFCANALRPNNPIMFAGVTNATGVSSVIDASQIMSGSIQASFSDSAAAGTLVLQCSNDQVAPTNWSTCANASNTGSVTVSAGALTFVSLQWLNSRWLRVSWTKSAGAGTITVVGFFQASGG